MGDIERRIFEDALGFYGVQYQERRLFEEMKELTQAISKYEDRKSRLENIAEKIADVSILLDQMILAFQCGGLVQQYRMQKVDRLLNQMVEEYMSTQDSGNPEDGSL